MAVNSEKACPVKKFVKAFDLTHVLPQDSLNKKYHILLGGPDMFTVQDAVKKLNNLFNIDNIVLTSGDAAVPELENIQILAFLDDVKVQQNSGTNKPTVRSNPSKKFAHNNVGYFLDILRAEAAENVSETSTKELSDAAVKENSSSSDVPEKGEFSDFITPPPKRRRVRKHKKKSQLTVDPSTDDQNGDSEQVPESQEPEAVALQALYSLKDTYKTAPIFKKLE